MKNGGKTGETWWTCGANRVICLICEKLSNRRLPNMEVALFYYKQRRWNDYEKTKIATASHTAA